MIIKNDSDNKYLKVMNRRSDRSIVELAIIHEIGKIINSTLEVKKIVSIILEMTRQVVNADRARLLLFKPNSREIELDTVYTSDATMTEKYLVLDNYAMEWMFNKSDALLLEDINKLNYFKSIPASHAGLRSLMLVPFVRKNQIIGAMILAKISSIEKFDHDDFRFVKTLANQVAVIFENAQLFSDLQTHFTDTIRALITAVETKDAYTYGHSDRVAEYALVMGKALGFDATAMRKLEYLALLHDVGKVAIDSQILKKNRKLNDKEWEIIRNHANLGSMIIKPIRFFDEEGVRTIRHHHEWYNGAGYPDGLTGDSIPIFSRIIAIADAFDAMTSSRPYRKSYQIDEALDELKKFSGKQFDPSLVELFCKSYKEEFPIII